jgi:hypothetical protein
VVHTPHEVDCVYFKRYKTLYSPVRHININALQRQQGVERNMITTGHDFKKKIIPNMGA